jgi:glycosyltransferase involved in cell wall biosynthesis
MVYGCIKDSDAYTLEYFSLNTFDVDYFSATGKIKRLERSQSGAPDILDGYDFWVFNWHPYTMASHLNPESIARLPGQKFTIVLELAPDNPLKLVPPGVFDGYIALDPTAPATDEIFPFPRPLQGIARMPRPVSQGVPVVGSFGYGTPGKGFELLVEAVNREFEKALIRVNIPRGTHVSTDVVHKQDYAKYIATICKKIAKPGIDVRFTYDFMSADELVDWCADNDLNCFMYTRCQPGLSATTDQAIMSGRPLLTLSNDTFRHIHPYIPPYPVIGLREAMETTVPAVARIQQDWSRATFNEKFHRMLAAFQLIAPRANDESAPAIPGERLVTIMVASLQGSDADDILHYVTRLADCLGRSGKLHILRIRCDNLAELEKRVDELHPSAVILIDFWAEGREALASAVKSVAGPKVVLVDESTYAAAQPDQKRDEMTVFRRQPIIPFFTVYAGLREPPGIWLIGFGAAQSNLEEVVARIAAEQPGARVFLEVPNNAILSLEQRVSRLQEKLRQSGGIQISISSLPAHGDEIINCLAADALTIFYHDAERSVYLENVSSLAMTTERPVIFTRAAPFPGYLGRGTYIEDLALSEIIASGMAAHIKLLHDFGEWQFSAKISRVLFGDAVKAQSEDMNSCFAAIDGVKTTSVVTATAEEILALRGGEFLDAAYKAVLGRAPDEDGRRHYLDLLRNGASRSAILAILRLSPEGRIRGADFTGLAAVVRRHRLSGIPLLGRMLRLGGRFARIDAARIAIESAAAPVVTASDILALRGSAFLDAAYKAVLGRLPDEGGRRNYLDLLLNGASQWMILAELRLSPEGRKRAANFPGLAAVIRRHRLLGAPILGSMLRVIGWSVDPVDVHHSLRVIDNQLHRLLEAQKTLPSVAYVDTTPLAVQAQAPELSNLPSIRTVAAVKADSPSIFLLVGLIGGTVAPVSHFAKRFERALVNNGGTVRIVLWNAAAKHLRLATLEELRQWELPTELSERSGVYPHDRDPQVIVRQTSCGKEDWLLVPETLHATTGQSDLVEMNAIMEGKRLGLRCAFVFHGAEPLRLTRFAGASAEAHEQYMQALLLADLVIPVSSLAAADLNDFLVQHQLADFVPLIRKVPFPAEVGSGDEAQWGRYARRIRGLLTEAADVSRHLTSLYYWINLDAPPSAARSVFAPQFAHALADRGVAVIPAAWDANTKRLVAVDADNLSCRVHAGRPSPWAPWIDFNLPDAPRWLFIPDSIQVELIAEVSAFVANHKLRIAAILHETAEQPGRSALTGDFSPRDSMEFEALARIDKVFAVSASRFRDFHCFLLSWRGKVHSAEHRFKTLTVPNEIAGQIRRVAAKPVTPGLVRIVAWMPCAHQTEQASLLVDASAHAAERSADRLVFTFVGRASDRESPANEKIRSRIASIPEARWEDGANSERISQLIENADFAIISGLNARCSPQVAESLWQALPCLVHDDNAISLARSELGLVSVDMRSAVKLTDAILELGAPEWRRSLANEAIARPVQSWNDYAKEIATELATDRITDTLYTPEKRGERDVYTTLVNLRRRPKLSLCISTYNRAGWLGVNLRNIFTQIPVERADLEVLVVDNTSTDNTPEVIAPYLHRADFRYARNDYNVGMLGNLAVTSQRARGEYVWILGDDDLTRPGIIERVLEIIRERPGIALIYINYGYTSEANPQNASDIAAFLDNYNKLEPPGPDLYAPVKLLAAKCENFYTAIYSHVYKRDHAIKSYCQDTSGRIFSTMASCIPTASYVLNYMPDLPAYWVGEPSLVVNSNVSWADYGALLDLEQLPRAWDLAERTGSVPSEVDRRRANRLWLVEMMWRDIFENDRAGNSAYFSAERVLMRLKHLEEIDKYIGEFQAIYQRAHDARHPAATLAPSDLFRAFRIA